ncbi:MAG: Omp28-related outer membrane protein [Flavobacteriales bacterium]|nr:Omp28-related outer membrane protein [Flavobacteriales bacterium]MCB9165764.1 Omp28-related outer membrane protein [Flavobacteriales bacterium]
MKKNLLLVAAISLVSTQVNAQCPVGESEVTVNVVLDRYGSEISWSLTGPNNTPVYASGDGYANATANGEYPLDPVTVCVPVGTQIFFHAEDSYGDGWCCAYGEGGYTVVVDGLEVASGGAFASSQTSQVFLGTDLAVENLTMEPVVVQGDLTITGSVVNTGVTPITSFTLTYTVDGGTPVSVPVTASIDPGESYTFSHPTPWSASLGSHSIAVDISDVPADGVASNDLLDQNVGVADQSAPRTTIIEQFTSSTCPPCASLNVTFGPTLTSLNTNQAGNNIAAIKYHMNWPSPGNDPSYNPDGNTRKSYYGVTGIPDLFIDGKPMTSVGASYIQDQAARNAFVDLQLSYWTNGNTINVTAEVTPLWEYTGTHKLHIGLVENGYDYAASTTTQDEFHFVQRKMLPNGQGNTLTPFAEDVTQTVNREYTMVFGGPAQGNYNFWDGGVQDVTVVAFVQNVSTKEILQAALAPVLVGMEENEAGQELRVFPNPTNGALNLMFDASMGSGNASIEVFNTLGERVYGINRPLNGGTQREVLDLSSLNDGVYFVHITADGFRASRTVNLTK